jgi:acetyl esterase/lipase
MTKAWLEAIAVGILLVAVGAATSNGQAPQPRLSPDQDSATLDESTNGSIGALAFRRYVDVVYKSDAEYELRCDVFVPEGDGPFPAVLALHGGAWRFGGKWQLARWPAKYAALSKKDTWSSRSSIDLRHVGNSPLRCRTDSQRCSGSHSMPTSIR